MSIITVSPTANIMKVYINMFLWMNGDYQSIDNKNELAPGGEQSYFVWNSFHNFGFELE